MVIIVIVLFLSPLNIIGQNDSIGFANLEKSKALGFSF